MRCVTKTHVLVEASETDIKFYNLLLLSGSQLPRRQRFPGIASSSIEYPQVRIVSVS